MAKAAQSRITADQISFELERFRLDGDRLSLRGRWFGVRGRRFVRPTLTPTGRGDRGRVLADLEHKPWAAEDGARWEATFPWEEDGGTMSFELSVAPDITIALPSPSGKLGRPRRLAALPRRAPIDTEWRAPQREPAQQEEKLEKPPAPLASELELAQAESGALGSELGAMREELESTRRMLTDRETELEAARSELAVARAERRAAGKQADELASELEQAERELAELRSELEQTGASIAQTEQGRDAAIQARDEAITERDEAITERDEAIHERDEAITARGAALVMRRAARAAPKRSWWRH